DLTVGIEALLPVVAVGQKEIVSVMSGAVQHVRRHRTHIAIEGRGLGFVRRNRRRNDGKSNCRRSHRNGDASKHAHGFLRSLIQFYFWLVERSLRGTTSRVNETQPLTQALPPPRARLSPPPTRASSTRHGDASIRPARPR